MTGNRADRGAGRGPIRSDKSRDRSSRARPPGTTQPSPSRRGLPLPRTTRPSPVGSRVPSGRRDSRPGRTTIPGQGLDRVVVFAGTPQGGGGIRHVSHVAAYLPESQVGLAEVCTVKGTSGCAATICSRTARAFSHAASASSSFPNRRSRSAMLVRQSARRSSLSEVEEPVSATSVRSLPPACNSRLPRPYSRPARGGDRFRLG